MTHDNYVLANIDNTSNSVTAVEELEGGVMGLLYYNQHYISCLQAAVKAQQQQQ